MLAFEPVWPPEPGSCADFTIDACTETRLRRIGEEIKKTSRRVNALEQLVIPNIGRQIKDIRSVLDQRALEEVTVLKRIKSKLEARDAEEAAAA